MTILDRATKLRLRRNLRRRQRQAEATTEQFDQHFQRNFIGRFGNLFHVKRFTIGWIALIVLLVIASIFQNLNLDTLYQVERPAYGGVYNEGIIGTYSTSNPVYATGAVDLSVARLLYDGLFTYDNQNKLVGDLAQGYTISENDKIYTVKLKPNLTWQDGAKLTADDVVYTFHLIQNPDVHSPYQPSWQGITIEKVDNLTIRFTLASALSAFPHSLTMGILPEHILSRIPVSELRASKFNTTEPVGSGAFTWDGLQLGGISGSGKATALIALKANTRYHAGRPHLNSFIFHTYESEDDLKNAFQKREVNAMAGLKNKPDIAKGNQSITTYTFPTSAAVMVFFKTTSGGLTDKTVRQALVYGTSRAEIIKELEDSYTLVRGPILKSQFAYDAQYAQPLYDIVKAQALLDQAGWVKGSDGIRAKDGVKLSFRLYAEDTADNRIITDALTRQYQQLGVQLITELQQPIDLQTTLELHLYDMLVRGISIGPDPDVFAYWDSSQADPRTNHLNFSEYKSSVADTAIEAGRTRSDQTIRAIKYKPFLKAWQEDAPAVGLYAPNIYYYSRGQVQGLVEHTLNTDVDRYNSVADWSIHTARVIDSR